MKTILIDINVFLDYLFQRGEYESAKIVLGLCFEKKLRGCVCAHEITTLSYFLERENKNRSENIGILSKILAAFQVLEVNKSILERALFSGIKDYEDAVIVESARKNGVEYIISENTDDFLESSVQTVTARAFCDMEKLATS